MSEPSEGQVVVASDLGREHHGWLMRYPLPPTDGPVPGPGHRTVCLIGVRRWAHEGVDKVGILADDGRSTWRGTEYHVAGATEVTLIRLIRKGVPRLRERDYASTDGGQR